MKLDFSSENFDKTHPAVLKALIKSNIGFAPSYGNDADTLDALNLFKQVFDTNEIEVFFCFNGTGANNFALSSISEKHSAILCSDVSHIYRAESTAPETFTGCRLYPLKTINGKIVIANFLLNAKAKNDIHLPPATVLTITQPTEYGTVYTLKELKIISRHCKENNILLHIDGARLFNALESINCTLADFIKNSGVDVLTLGGTKSGLMFGEAVIFFKCKRFKNIKYNHKRSMQLASKNRFIAIQFTALMKDELWKKVASHTNKLAKYFEQELSVVNKSAIAYPIETNVIFLKMKQGLFDKLKLATNFYMWDNEKEVVRLIFSFSNTKCDIINFLNEYKKAMKFNFDCIKA